MLFQVSIIASLWGFVFVLFSHGLEHVINISETRNVNIVAKRSIRSQNFDPSEPAVYTREAIWCEPNGDSGSGFLESLLWNRHISILPNGLPVSSYQNVTAFCASWYYGGLPESNMGGECVFDDDEDGTIEFLIEYGDSRLFLRPALQRLCLEHCSCIGETRPGRRISQPIAEPSEDFLDEQLLHNFDRMRLDGEDITKLPNINYGPILPDDGSSLPHKCHSHQQCRDFACSWTGASGCRCLATGLQKGLFTVMGCGIIASMNPSRHRGRLGGRSVPEEYETERVGCPCNATYVSLACCDSQDGIIWELPGLKLGELHPGLI